MVGHAGWPAPSTGADARWAGRLTGVSEGPPVMRWPHLVVLMALGDGPEPAVRGLVHARTLTPVSSQLRPTGPVQDVPGLGPCWVAESTYRLLKKGPRLRREHLDGHVASLQEGMQHWIPDPDQQVAAHLPAGYMTWPDQQLSERRPLRQWDRGDFTQPTRPPAATTFLGRAAWQVEVAPPPHKPFPLTYIIDDQTGMVLLAVGADGHQHVAWLELEVGCDLDDQLFAWSGRTRPWEPGDRQPSLS